MLKAKLRSYQLKMLVDVTHVASTDKLRNVLTCVDIIVTPAGIWLFATDSYCLVLRKLCEADQCNVDFEPFRLLVPADALKQVVNAAIKDGGGPKKAVADAIFEPERLTIGRLAVAALDLEKALGPAPNGRAPTPVDFLSLIDGALQKFDETGVTPRALGFNPHIMNRLAKALGCGDTDALIVLCARKEISPYLVSRSHMGAGYLENLDGFGLLMPVRLDAVLPKREIYPTVPDAHESKSNDEAAA